MLVMDSLGNYHHQKLLITQQQTSHRHDDNHNPEEMTFTEKLSLTSPKISLFHNDLRTNKGLKFG